MLTHRGDVLQARLGQSLTCALRAVNRKISLRRTWFRKGMVLLSGVGKDAYLGSTDRSPVTTATTASTVASAAASASAGSGGVGVGVGVKVGGEWMFAPRGCREFEAEVVVLNHSTTIAVGYQPVIHCGVLRQSAEIISIEACVSPEVVPTKAMSSISSVSADVDVDKDKTSDTTLATTATAAVSTGVAAAPLSSKMENLRTGEREFFAVKLKMRCGGCN